jgi:hypothetical protein
MGKRAHNTIGDGGGDPGRRATSPEEKLSYLSHSKYLLDGSLH